MSRCLPSEIPGDVQRGVISYLPLSSATTDGAHLGGNPFASSGRKSGADRQQNTDTHHARVYYPLHPLAGQTLRVGKRRRGPSPTYYLVTGSGEGFSVPVWMTEPSAANLRHEDVPRLHLRALIEIVGLTRQGLESIGLHEKILPSDQAKESLCDDQPTPADIDTGAAPRRTTSTARRSEREHRADREDALGSRSRPAGERRENGGAR